MRDSIISVDFCLNSRGVLPATPAACTEGTSNFDLKSYIMRVLLDSGLIGAFFRTIINKKSSFNNKFDSHIRIKLAVHFCSVQQLLGAL